MKLEHLPNWDTLTKDEQTRLRDVYGDEVPDADNLTTQEELDRPIDG